MTTVSDSPPALFAEVSELVEGMPHLREDQFGRARAAVALKLAAEIDQGAPPEAKSWSPAPLFKELRAALGDLEQINDRSGNDRGPLAGLSAPLGESPSP
ncbi:MAG: hypothetical protein AAGA95_18415 [Pseudomonadota bacterium]